MEIWNFKHNLVYKNVYTLDIIVIKVWIFFIVVVIFLIFFFWKSISSSMSWTSALIWSSLTSSMMEVSAKPYNFSIHLNGNTTGVSSAWYGNSSSMWSTWTCPQDFVVITMHHPRRFLHMLGNWQNKLVLIDPYILVIKQTQLLTCSFSNKKGPGCIYHYTSTLN